MKVEALTLKGNCVSNDDVFMIDRFVSSGGLNKNHQRKKVKIYTKDLQVTGVLDGISGESFGYESAQEAALAIKKHMETMTDDERKEVDLELLVKALLNIANEAVCDFCDKMHSLSGSTINLFAIRENSFACGNIGDSETYMFRQGQLIPLSQPQTVASWKESMGFEATHKEHHILYHYLGENEKDTAYVTSGELQAGDKILLCTDGLSKVLSREEICSFFDNDGTSTMKRFRKFLLPRHKELPDNTTMSIIEI